MEEDKINLTSIDFLDKALLLLKNESAFGPIGFNRPNLSDIERKLLIRAFYKLEKDGFAYSEKRENGNNTSHRFYISFDGLLVLEEYPPKWKNRPYRWAANKKLLIFNLDCSKNCSSCCKCYNCNSLYLFNLYQ